MKLGWAMLANYAEQNSGLITVAGGTWDTINVQAQSSSLPPGVVAVAVGCVIFRILFHRTETDRDHGLELRVLGEDGQEVARINAELAVPLTPNLPQGWDQGVNAIISVAGMPLPRFGLYSLSILVDAQHLGDVPFRVIKGY